MKFVRFQTASRTVRTYEGFIPSDITEGDVALSNNPELWEMLQELNVEVDDDQEELIRGSWHES